MLEILCIHCCEKTELPEYISIDKFEGDFRCKKCCARLSIKFSGSEKPAKYKLIEKPTKEPIQITQVEIIKDYSDRPPTKIE